MPVQALFVTALVVAAVRRSVWAGVQVAVWTALLASLAFYAIAVSEGACPESRGTWVTIRGEL
jgi:hypothetical protein